MKDPEDELFERLDPHADKAWEEFFGQMKNSAPNITALNMKPFEKFFKLGWKYCAMGIKPK